MLEASPSPNIPFCQPTDEFCFKRWGAGGDASIAELEAAGTRDPKWLIDRANKFLDAGAYVSSISLHQASVE